MLCTGKQSALCQQVVIYGQTVCPFSTEIVEKGRNKAALDQQKSDNPETTGFSRTYLEPIDFSYQDLSNNALYDPLAPLTKK